MIRTIDQLEKFFKLDDFSSQIYFIHHQIFDKCFNSIRKCGLGMFEPEFYPQNPKTIFRLSTSVYNAECKVDLPATVYVNNIFLKFSGELFHLPVHFFVEVETQRIYAELYIVLYIEFNCWKSNYLP